MTPLAETPIDWYGIFLRLSPSLEIVRYLTDDTDTAVTGISTDLAGQFSLLSPNLGLSLTTYSDREVCQDVCVSYAEDCYDYPVKSCACVEYTDKDGNPYQDCTSDCVTTYETSCSSYCSAYTTDCSTVTDEYTHDYDFDQVKSVRTEIQITAADGTPYIVPGTSTESHRGETCRRTGRAYREVCSPDNSWIQSDRFVTPFVAAAASQVRVAPGVRGLTARKRLHLEASALTEAQMDIVRESRALLGITPDRVHVKLGE